MARQNVEDGFLIHAADVDGAAAVDFEDNAFDGLANAGRVRGGGRASLLRVAGGRGSRVDRGLLCGCSLLRSLRLHLRFDVLNTGGLCIRAPARQPWR